MTDLPAADSPSPATTPAPASLPLPQPLTIVIREPGSSAARHWATRVLGTLLVISVLFNLALYSSWSEYLSRTEPLERFHSGDESSPDKLAVIDVAGTLMPPLTERTLRAIERADEDERVKGVLLVVDSPGGLVADSQQIYHRLTKLREKKPVFVSMKRMAASGGLYIAMGAGSEGQIFAEPTTWTGSIGVIIPRFDASGLAEKVGVESQPIKTGEFKDALNPFRPMTERERTLWADILDQSFQQFLAVIDDNRAGLDLPAVKRLATGQIYTARDARRHGLVDHIGYEDDAIAALERHLEIEDARVVRYVSPPGLLELVLGVQARQPEPAWQALLEASVPRAMYYCSWAPLVPAP